MAEEALEFCVEYLSNHDFIGLPPSCIGGGEVVMVDASLLQQAHFCVLKNTIEFEAYIK